MRNRFFISLCCSFLLFFGNAQSQVQIRTGETISCGVDFSQEGKISINRNNNHLRKKAIAGRTNDVEPIFSVKYTGFTEEAKNAFQYAVDIWERTIKSDVKIQIFANWAFLDNVSTLAFVTPTEVKNFEGAPINNLWYPIALAEKLARQNINPTTEADIVATFNSRREDWYFGTDGNCPLNKLDLVTVVLHELGHGLGFSGTFRVSNSNGLYGLNDGLPKIYDTYLQNSADQFLVDFTNGSLLLGNQITSNSVTFLSPIARLLSSTTADPRVYAPSPYNPGSSISHLDEGTYSDTPNSLMTPFAEFGKVAHDCGSLVRGMFYEMGWLHTFLEHDFIGDQEDLTDTKFRLGVFSDTVVQSSSIKMHYSFDGFLTSNELQLTESFDVNYFEGQLVNPTPETLIGYYFEVKDVLNRTFRYPAEPAEFLSFYFGADVINPTISHTPPDEIIQFEPALDLLAVVKDNIGIQNVIFEYQINEGSFFTEEMVSSSNDNYTLKLDLSSMDIKQGDKINYRIIATDASVQENIAIFPATGLSTVEVKTFEVKDVFLSTLDSDQKEFFGDFNILTPAGFTNGAIHSPHPYVKSETGGTNYSHVLLYPIKLKAENSFLDFDEVVLIEPGTADDFNNPAFGDYVIVEGSKDDGQTWVPLIPGYDSRKFNDWLTYYNSNIKDGDSRAIGTLNYYKHNQINLLSVFAAGDEVYIRFRLFSDNSKVGWGWAIDNLKIQDVVLAAEDFRGYNSIGIYPNPTDGEFSLDLGDSTRRPTQITIYDLRGRKYQDLSIEGTIYKVSELPSGMYILRINFDDGLERSFKLMKK